MKKPTLPANEKERLRVLQEYQILDTLPEDLYDDITKIASQICETPISLISLIDDSRQWFKSHHGLDVSETDKDVAYCAHAINEPDKILEVPDAFEDERFHDNPLATGEPHVRFYAGAPLTTKDGYSLGTLCVIDHEKKKLTEGQKTSLWALSRQVVALLELRKENHQRELIDQDLTTLLENLGDGVFELDAFGNCVYINSRMLEMLNRSHEEAVSTPIWQMIYQEDVSGMQRFYQDQFKKKSPYCYYEYRLNRPGKEPVWVGQSTTMQYNGDEMIKLRSIARDLSRTKSLEQELELKETLYKLVSENSNDIIAIHEPNGNYKFISPSVQDILGFQPSELIGKNPYDYIHPDDAKRLRNGPHEKTLKGATQSQIDYRLLKKDGSYVWLEAYSKPIFDKNGQVTSFQTSSRDISDKKIEQDRGEKYREGLTILNQLASSSLPGTQLIELALKQIAEYLDLDFGAVSEVSNESFLVKSFVSREISFEQLEGKTYSLKGTFCEFVLKSATTLLVDEKNDFEYSGHPSFPNQSIDIYIGTTVQKSGRPYGTVSFFSKRSEGRKFAHYEGEFIQLFANWIGSVLESEEERTRLEEARANAETASQAKDSFLSMMSHEIRTPLNGIIGSTHLLLNKPHTKEQLQHLTILKQSSSNLHSLVNDILDFNKIEEGKLEIDSTDFDLRNTVKTIYENYAFQGSEKGINVQLELGDSISDSYLGDALRIGQVLHNLVSNAVKFTSKGSVLVAVNVHARHGDYDEVRFKVSDSGIGIPVDKHKEIFDVFSQQDLSTTRKFGGSGLGLAIIKRLLLLMGSEIQLESQLGQGSTFSFDLILKRLDEKNEENQKASTVEFRPLSARILLVEDNPFNMAIARDFLESWDCQVLEATNGREALELLDATQVDLVLLDLQMPELDGFETIKVLRNSQDIRQRELPVVALTAAALGDVQEKVFEAGMDDFVTKPFLPTDFYAKLSSNLRNHVSTNESQALAQIQKKLSKTLGDKGGIEKYISIFIETINEEILVLKGAILSQDADMISAYAHKNKSSFKLVGLEEIAAEAEDLEKMIERNNPLEMITNKAKKHEEKLTAIIKQLMR